jgi:hypothetical protein
MTCVFEALGIYIFKKQVRYRDLHWNRHSPAPTPAMLKGLVLALALFAGSLAEPTVKLGKTTLVGRSIPTLGQEFFGGMRRDDTRGDELVG